MRFGALDLCHSALLIWRLLPARFCSMIHLLQRSLAYNLFPFNFVVLEIQMKIAMFFHGKGSCNICLKKTFFPLHKLTKDCKQSIALLWRDYCDHF